MRKVHIAMVAAVFALAGCQSESEERAEDAAEVEAGEPGPDAEANAEASDEDAEAADDEG